MKAAGITEPDPATAVTSGAAVGAGARRAGLVVLATAVLFFCYWRQSQAVALSYMSSTHAQDLLGAREMAVPAENEPLASWLVAHRLTDGLATYWQANSTTVDSHGQVRLSAVVQDVRDRLAPYLWETNVANYDPAQHYANFVVADSPSALPGTQLSAELTFGRPARTYHADGYTILVWNTNPLDKLDGPGLK